MSDQPTAESASDRIHMKWGSITLFDGTNYAIWSLQCRAVLGAIRALEIVTGKRKRPGDDDPVALEEWRKVSGKAIAVIVGTVASHFLHELDSFVENQDAAGLWGYMDNNFNRARSPGLVRNARDAFYRLQIDFRRESIREFIFRLSQIRAELQNSSEPITDEEFVIKLRASIPANHAFWLNTPAWAIPYCDPSKSKPTSDRGTCVCTAKERESSLKRSGHDLLDEEGASKRPKPNDQNSYLSANETSDAVDPTPIRGPLSSPNSTLQDSTVTTSKV